MSIKHLFDYRTPFVFLCLALLVASACGAAPQERSETVESGIELGAGSPEDLVARMNAALQAGDFRAFAACLAPESRLDYAETTYFMTALMIGFSAMAPAMGEMAAGAADDMAEGVGGEPGAQQALEEDLEFQEAKAQAERMFARFNEVATRHGLPTLEEDGEEGDPEALRQAIADVEDPIALVGDLGDTLQWMGELLGSEGGPSEDLAAMGELSDLEIDGDHARGKIGNEAIEFVRVDGRWFAKPKKPELF